MRPYFGPFLKSRIEKRPYFGAFWSPELKGGGALVETRVQKLNEYFSNNFSVLDFAKFSVLAGLFIMNVFSHILLVLALLALNEFTPTWNLPMPRPNYRFLEPLKKPPNEESTPMRPRCFLFSR